MDEKYTSTLKTIALLGGMNDHIAISSRELGDILNMSQQSASKRILELLEAKYIVRDLGARRQRIKLTENGVNWLKSEYNEYRRIFELTDHMTLRGRVTAGMGQGGYYISQPQYVEQFEKTLGFSPFEGTLNIVVDKEDIGKLGVLRGSAGHLIKGFDADGRTFGNVVAHKAKIRNVDCAIVMPERSHYSDVVEVICKYHLRRTLSLKDRDFVEVKIEI